jgi:predicted  nucleic acid-binding Zn-ribbon protein
MSQSDNLPYRSENKEEMTRWEKLYREANAERLKYADKIQTLEVEKSSVQSEHVRLQERLQNQDRNFAEKQEHVQAQIASLGAEKAGLIEQIERLKELLERQTVKTTEKEREYYA